MACASSAAALDAPSIGTSWLHGITELELTQIREFSNSGGQAFSISPNGQWLAANVRQGDAKTNRFRTAWFVISTHKAGSAVKVADAGDIWLSQLPDGRVAGGFISSPARWSPDSQWIAYLLKHDGEVQLWRSRSDGSLTEQLTRSAADIQDFAWSPSGAQLMYTAEQQTRAQRVNARQAEALRGYLADERFFSRINSSPLSR